jgi:hypothetical protein
MLSLPLTPIIRDAEEDSVSALFKAPTVNMPPPTPASPPPAPDPYNPAAMEAAKVQAAQRAGRSSTVLTTAARGQANGGSAIPYGGTTLGGG